MPELDSSDIHPAFNEENNEYIQPSQPNLIEIPTIGSIRSNDIQKHHDNIESDSIILVKSKQTQQPRPNQSRAYSDSYGNTEKNDNNKNNNNNSHGTNTNKSINRLNTYRRWNKVKQLARNGINTMSLRHTMHRHQNKKTKNNIDDNQDNKEYKKGTALMRQLEINRASVSVLALSFQKDEKNLPRIPILASLLDIRIIKKKTTNAVTTSENANNVFYIIVQYGTTQWTIKRRYWDFVKLHYSYYGKDITYSLKRPADFPVFPKIMLQKTYRQINTQKNETRHGLKKKSYSASTFNLYHRNHHQQQNNKNEDQQQHDRCSIHSDSDLYNKKQNKKENLKKDTGDRTSDNIIVINDTDEETELFNNKLPSTSSTSPNTNKLDYNNNNLDNFDDTFVEKQLEMYLNQLITFTFTSGNINRLCKFLEISTLGIHVKATQPRIHHRKEGYLMILKRSDREPPRRSKWLLQGGCFGQRFDKKINNRIKWFIIQDNYIACVHHPHELDICDVFLIDNRLQVERGYSNQLVTKFIKSTSHFSLGRSTLHLEGTHGSLVLYSKSVQHAIQFEKALLKVIKNSPRCQPNQRFSSFAPIRNNCPTTWFVDGKDYFWNVSVALDNAKESIYIHDWWLSPELYLRRIPSENKEWRLDTLLKKKADQGVKVYIIVYKEVAMTIPLFSHYTKKYLQSLSKNIYVQRHPSRILDLFGKQNTLFWAHHEKMCIVDGVVAFIGGLDLCFGRFDDAHHKITDNPINSENQTWVGKDYSNPRIEDAQALDKPFEDHLDRSRLPRMPWHDISVRICGEAVCDLEYHFVQRWNYLLKRKASAPKRPTPLLVPKSDVQQQQNEECSLDLNNDPRIVSLHSSLNTQVQILRSSSSWSNGINYTEHSIQNAYIELIKKSNHLVYIENQFFITSTKCGTTVIENQIGEALYQRILRAHKERQKWHAIIILPLTPEFPGRVDVAEGSTIRLIMHCQYLSIGRGSNSLLGRLRAAGVTKTSDYISFYGLRNWGELNGAYTTEQVYIHAKTLIVDDSTVVIGSANINERSMLGSRDSEICACIQDTEMIDSTLGGNPIKVGKFAHSLRLRLMAEHIGLPVDNLTADMIINKCTITNKEKINKRKDSMLSIHQDKIKYDNRSLDEGLKIEPTISLSSPPHHMDSKKNDLDTLSSSSSSSTATTTSALLPSMLHSKTDQQTYDMQSEQKSNVQVVTEMDALTAAKTRTLNDDSNHLSYIAKLTTTHLIDDEMILYCKKGEAWDTDTDNNGDGVGLIPLPLPIAIETPEEEIKDTNDEDKNDEDKNHKKQNNQPSILKIRSIDPFNNNIYESNVDEEKKEKMDWNEHENNVHNIDFMFQSLRDPLQPNHYHLWHTRARYNTDIFRRCFMVVPENNIRTWAAFEEFHKMAKRLLGRSDVYEGVTKIKESIFKDDHLIHHSQQKGLFLPFITTLLEQIKGHLVIWPLHFMEDEGDDFLFAMDKIAPLEIFN